MTTLAVYSPKGGVGKTTTAVNLAWIAAESGLNTLLCDFDAQGAASYLFDRKAKKEAAKRLLRGKAELGKLIRETDHERLDLLPASRTYRDLDLLLDDEKKSRRKLKDLLDRGAADYDLVLIDAPPQMTLLSEAILRASRGLIVPVIPTPLAIRMIDELQEMLAERDFRVEDMLMVFTMVDRRKRLHREIAEGTDERYWGGDIRSAPLIARTVVPLRSDIEQMSATRKPVAASRSARGSAPIYRALWHEVASLFSLEAPTSDSG